MAAAHFNEIAKRFVEEYYRRFDQERHTLSGLMADSVMMTFEGQEYAGKENVNQKLANLSFQKVQHAITTIDSHPTADMNGVIIFVVGMMKTDDDPPHTFSEVFVVKAHTGSNSFFVHNVMFRLALHHQ